MPAFNLFRCDACRVLRRQCSPHCIFAPYFCHEEGFAHFAAIHNIFGARIASILLTYLLVSDRLVVIMTLLFEAQARLQDPVYGCVSHILALQQQVSDLQAHQAYLQNSLFAYYSLHPQPVPQPVQNPSWNFDLPIIPEDIPHPNVLETTLPSYPGEASSSQMPPPNDINELGPVVFGNRRRH
ncbi:LOB domain-containing protein 29-like [Diospyros lotus]|uniref:LOB domain-containing protein 29-like n=1 Tax=Diospyros lotus TaxID=55363 RepID=UPI0022560DD5|nr:LOB domain-containing protein 29-like [Diospyros lotus]